MMHSVSLGSIECVVWFRCAESQSTTFWFLTTRSIFKRQLSKNEFEIWPPQLLFGLFSTFDRMWHCDPIPVPLNVEKDKSLRNMRGQSGFHNKASPFIVLVLHLTNPLRKSIRVFPSCQPDLTQSVVHQVSSRTVTDIPLFFPLDW